MAIPPDFSLQYFWSGPTVRPPYHYEYTITIGPGLRGNVSYSPDYPNHNPPHWQAPFEIPQEAMESLYELAVKINLFRPSWKQRASLAVGGEQAWLNAFEGELHASIPTGLIGKDLAQAQPFYEAIRVLVPQTVWDQLEALRQKYIAEHLT
jgi:hypothetical protein